MKSRPFEIARCASFATGNQPWNAYGCLDCEGNLDVETEVYRFSPNKGCGVPCNVFLLLPREEEAMIAYGGDSNCEYCYPLSEFSSVGEMVALAAKVLIADALLAEDLIQEVHCVPLSCRG